MALSQLKFIILQIEREIKEILYRGNSSLNNENSFINYLNSFNSWIQNIKNEIKNSKNLENIEKLQIHKQEGAVKLSILQGRALKAKSSIHDDGKKNILQFFFNKFYSFLVF